jgi:hypothetical protein
MNLLKMTILPGFRARARPGLKYLNIFWPEKLVLVIIQQIFSKNVEKTFFIAFLDQSTYTFLIFGRPDSLQSSRTSCKPIFNRQKAFSHHH